MEIHVWYMLCNGNCSSLVSGGTRVGWTIGFLGPIFHQYLQVKGLLHFAVFSNATPFSNLTFKSESCLVMPASV